MEQCQQKMLCSHLLSISPAPASMLRTASTDHSSRTDGQNVTDTMFFAECVQCDLLLSLGVFLVTHLYERCTVNVPCLHWKAKGGELPVWTTSSFSVLSASQAEQRSLGKSQDLQVASQVKDLIRSLKKT